MRKKVEKGIVFGVLLFSIGLLSATYSISAFIINIIFIRQQVFILPKDIVFDIVFILLGLILIRKQKNKNFVHG